MELGASHQCAADNDLGMTQEWHKSAAKQLREVMELCQTAFSLKNLQINYQLMRQGIRSRALEQSCHEKEKLRR